MATYFVTTAITGKAFCEVEADSEEEAIEKSWVSDDWEIEEWDRETEGHRGGYIEVQEA